MTNTVSFPGIGLEFTFQNAITIGPFQLTYYGMIIALGMILAMVYAFRVFRKVGVDPDKAVDAIIGGVIGGIVGARLYFVAFKWEDFRDNPLDIFKIWEGGLAIYGGLIGALLVGVLIAKWRKIHISSLLDVVGVGFLLGQGIGRWGNFFNVEAFGDNTALPWGMTGPKVVSYLTAHQSELAELGITVDPNMPVHPTFLYESLWCLLGFLLLALYMKRRKFDGEVFLMYLGYYGLERAVVEGMRTDSLMIGTLRVSRLLAILLVIASVLAIILIRRKIRNNHDDEYMKLFVLTEEGQRILNRIPEEKTEKPGKKDKASKDKENTEACETVMEENESVEDSSEKTEEENSEDSREETENGTDH